MPVTVAAPLNTGGTAQTKTGALALTGNLTASSFIDFDNYNYYVNPSGQTLLAGPVGIGTASPSSGSKFHILQSSYGYQDSVVESALPSIRLVDNENGQSSFGFLADGSNFYLDAYTYANRFANSYGSHILTIQSDGKVTIADGGQLCIGTSCVASSTWATMASAAGGGGSAGKTDTVPIDLSPCAGDYNGCGGTVADMSYDPGSNRLTAVFGYPAVFSAGINMSDLTPVATGGTYWADGTISQTFVGSEFCTLNNTSYARYGCNSPLLSCRKGTGTVYQLHPIGACGSGISFLPASNTYRPSRARSDGTYLYLFDDGSYSWKISFNSYGAMTVVDHGSGIARPTVDGISLKILGSPTFPYNHVIYEAKGVPDYDRSCNSLGQCVLSPIGYSFFWLRQVGTY